MSAKRYHWDSDKDFLVESEHGALVLASDYDALTSELIGNEIAWKAAGADYQKAQAHIDELERALYGAAEALASFRPRSGDSEECDRPYWTELDEVTLHDAQRLCGKYPQLETKGDAGG